MHTGSRHLSFSLTDGQKKLMQKPIAQMLVMFAMFYVSTRSVFWSVTLIAAYFVAVNILLNENHPFNIFSRDWLKKEGFILQGLHDMGSQNTYLENLKRLP